MSTEQRRIAPLQERDRMKREIANAEADGRGESPEFNRADKRHSLETAYGRKAMSAGKVQLDRLRRVASEGEPDSLSEDERNRKESRVKELSKILSGLMVTRKQTRMNQYEKGNLNVEFSRAAHQMANQENSPRFQQMAVEWKNLRRELLPDDPNAGNLETIRPK